MPRIPLKTWADCTPENPYVIFIDTLCTGWQSIREDGGMDADNASPPLLYKSPKELSKDMNDSFFNADGDLVAMPLKEFMEQGGNGRKAIYIRDPDRRNDSHG